MKPGESLYIPDRLQIQSPCNSACESLRMLCRRMRQSCFLRICFLRMHLTLQVAGTKLAEGLVNSTRIVSPLNVRQVMPFSPASTLTSYAASPGCRPSPATCTTGGVRFQYECPRNRKHSIHISGLKQLLPMRAARHLGGVTSRRNSPASPPVSGQSGYT